MKTSHTAANDWCEVSIAAEAKYGHIHDWDTSRVTSMNNLFCNKRNFNDDLSNWDVSAVTDMSRMFHRASSYSGDLSNWDMSAVTNIRRMFLYCPIATEHMPAKCR